jgi:hypothetical protein
MEPSVDALKNFMTEKRFVLRALSHLREGREISVVLDNVPHALFHRGGKVQIEERVSVKPDVEFILGGASCTVLAAFEGDDAGMFGVQVLKQYLAGDVKIRVFGSVTSILMGGYLGIITEGGASFSRFLAENGLTSLKRLPEILAKLRAGK